MQKQPSLEIVNVMQKPFIPMEMQNLFFQSLDKSNLTSDLTQFWLADGTTHYGNRAVKILQLMWDTA